MRWTLAAAVVLLLATAFELALALDVVHIGNEPGADAPGSSAVALAGVVALVVGAIRSPWRPSVALAPAAAAFLVMFEATYDPYDAPAKRRYLDGGAVPLGYTLVLAGIALLLALLTWRRARPAGVATSLFLMVVAVSYLFAGAGH